MRRHLPLASASAVVFVVLTSLLIPGQEALGQVKSNIQARAQVVNAQASWIADSNVRDMLERAFSRVAPTGSPIDMVMKMKAAAGHAPDGIGVFFDIEGRASLTGSLARPVFSAGGSVRSERVFADRRLYTGSAILPSAMKREMAEPERLVVYIHHLAN